MALNTGLPTVLENIVATRRTHLPQIRAQLAGITAESLPVSQRSLFESLRSGGTGNGRNGREGRHFIMECKSASPSLGAIRPDYDPAAIARIYSRYAAGISVLCEPEFFGGSYQHLSAVSATTHLPVLCKDFIIDPIQIIAARYYGADAILLMLSVLDDESYRLLAKLATQLGLDILTEVVDEEEVARAIALGANIFGINHRNLHDLSIDLERSARLEKLVPTEAVVVSESGIRDNRTVRKLSGHSDAFLVGSQLTSQPDIDLACRELVYGAHKVCGLRSIAEAQNIRANGASYGGLIFEEASPRNVSRETSQKIIAGTPGLKFVAVSRRIQGWGELVADLGISAVQVHAPLLASATAELELMHSIRTELPQGVEYWRAISMTDSAGPGIAIALAANEQVDKLLLDSGVGGTGEAFDWAKIPPAVAKKSLLAGGLKLANIPAALSTGVAGLDLNSGLEYPDGSAKDPGAVRRAFEAIRIN
ncbi:bifunctional indole-3-glycerol-phosphate synthase TrpC/phosphoribosylanthranilate isomerase TrpF [Corynebacterium caspium]|uniref:bifunctional indole-3-glycerol-phosphate synthase TrpC/phosphoribosylanthranilate isomerase TrpF n=1 Tax=Corynebacterium caspium TaxID=234828 RepID=UPI00036AB3F2|nr:bifunctional indole-3-glycerol-phosphate synthase TrpC/phosphoribosylanthranilate isomerase TrpF [Corynebacterium caspium]WKD60045.1 Tryptophan biosynthesis protein TrpCF [Corynebacterium caspium DSM 44850]